MNYEIELGSDAQKYLSKMEKPFRIRILDQLHILSENPRHPELNIKKLQGYINCDCFILYKYFHVKSPFHFSRAIFRYSNKIEAGSTGQGNSFPIQPAICTRTCIIINGMSVYPRCWRV